MPHFTFGLMTAIAGSRSVFIGFDLAARGYQVTTYYVICQMRDRMKQADLVDLTLWPDTSVHTQHFAIQEHEWGGGF